MGAGDYQVVDGYGYGEINNDNVSAFGQNFKQNNTHFTGMAKLDGNNTQSNNSNGMSTFGKINAGINTVMGLANLYSTFQQNSLAKKAFNYNKDMMNKNYALTKDAYDRRVRRSQNIGRQVAGESYESVQRDQERYDREREQRMKGL